MPKVCNEPDCTYHVFGKGYCKWHQYRRADKKTSRVRQLRPISKKKENTGEGVLFLTIWNSRRQVSYLSGKDLSKYYGTDLFVNLFAHLLSKSQGKYPKFKLYEKNIVLLTPTEHSLLDHGTEEQREKYAKENGCSWKSLYCLREEIEKEYVELYGGPRRYCLEEKEGDPGPKGLETPF